MNSLELARQIIQAATEVKAEKPVIMDMRKLTSVADYFIVMHGRSDRQVKAIANRIEADIRHRKGFRPRVLRPYIYH